MQYDMQKDIIYLRLSMEDAEKQNESNSISSQRACIQQYLQNRPDLKSAFEEIVDDGYSGTGFDRPGMKQLLAMIEAGQVRTLIVRDLSRFARNYLEAGYYLEIIFPTMGVRFISVNDGFDSDELGEDTGGLELAIRNLINQMYSRDISRKIKSVVDMKKQNGEYAFGAVPYGYKKGKEHNKIVVDEPAAKIVRRIFDWAVEGFSITQIALKLNKEHIVTPSVYLAGVRGKYKTRAFWTYDSVRNILGNRIYTGDTEVFKSHVTRVGSKRVNIIPEELRQVVPDTHEAIISRSTYYLARKTIKVTAPKAPSRGWSEPLSSYLVCGCCGNRLTKGKQKNKTWLCASARYTQETECGLVRMDDQKLRDILLRAMQAQCEIFDAKVKKLRTAQKKTGADKAFFQKELKYCQRRTEHAEQGKMDLYEQYTDGRLRKEEFLARKEELSAQLADLEGQIDLLQKKLRDMDALDRDTRQRIYSMEEQTGYLMSTELTPALMKALVQKIVVYPENRLQIQWSFRDEFQQLQKSEILLPSESA